MLQQLRSLENCFRLCDLAYGEILYNLIARVEHIKNLTELVSAITHACYPMFHCLILKLGLLSIIILYSHRPKFIDSHKLAKIFYLMTVCMKPIVIKSFIYSSSLFYTLIYTHVYTATRYK